MPDNFKLVDKYVESKITRCALEDIKYPHSFALGSLQAQVVMMLTKLEAYHPEAYITAVEEFKTNEGENP